MRITAATLEFNFILRYKCVRLSPLAMALSARRFAPPHLLGEFLLPQYPLYSQPPKRSLDRVLDSSRLHGLRRTALNLLDLVDLVGDLDCDERSESRKGFGLRMKIIVVVRKGCILYEGTSACGFHT